MLTDGVVTLRPPTEDDVDAIVEACQDPEIPRWTNVPSPYRREQALEWLARRDERSRPFLGFVDGRLAGSFSVMELDLDAGYGEIGYWVAAPARRRGVATRAVTLLRDWAARELGLQLIELLIHEANGASRGVAERAGFRATGERRPAPRTETPGPLNHLVYAWSRS